jgi:putative inorganic carbon (HCO3(-)) transporter
MTAPNHLSWSKRKYWSFLFSAETIQLFLLFSIILLQPFRGLHGFYDSLLGCALIFIIIMIFRGRFLSLPRAFLYILGFYTASVLISTLFSIDVKGSLNDVRSEFAKQLIVFGLVVVTGAQQEKKLRTLLLAFFLSGLIMSTVGFFPFLLWGSYASPENAGIGPRLVSFSGSYTRLGYFYVLYAPFLILLARGRSTAPTIAIYAILCLALGATFCTLTRAAWICVPLAVIVACVLMKMWRHLAAFLLIICTLLFPVYALSPSVQSRVRDFNELLLWSGSFGQRIALWESAGRTIAQHPIFGVGYGKYIFREAYDLNPVNGGAALCDVHNTYLEILLERGIVGFIAVVALYAYFFRRANLLAKTRETWGRAYFAYFVAISCAFALFSLTGNIYLKETGRYLWQLIALSWCIPLSLSKSKGPDVEGVVKKAE